MIFKLKMIGGGSSLRLFIPYGFLLLQVSLSIGVNVE